MKPRTFSELIEIYEFLKRHCSKAELFKEFKVRNWVDAMSAYDSIYYWRPNKDVSAVMFGWPVSDLDSLNPRIDPKGDTFYVRFCHVSLRSRKQKGLGKSRPLQSLMADVVAAREQYENLARVFFLKRKEGEVLPKLFQLVK